MISFRNFSIKQQLIGVILLVSGLSLLLAGVILIIDNHLSAQKALQRNLVILAQVVGINSTASLAFNDPDSATKNLAVLKVKPDIDAAAIYSKNGTIFAVYYKDSSLTGFIFPSTLEQVPQLQKNQSELVAPILLENEKVGTLAIVYNTQELSEHLKEHVLIVMIVLLASVFTAFFLSNSLQEIISKPIEQLAKTAHQLESTNKELDAFSYSVSHDLRAPLRAINGFSLILREEYEPRLDAEGKRLIDVIRGSVQKMDQLITELLAFARLNKQMLQKAPLDMTLLVQEAFNDLKSLESDRKITFLLESLAPSDGDAAMISQVWINLLSNALKFTQTRSHAMIEITSSATSTEMLYRIRDNGVGFDMKYVHKLFGVFQRLHNDEEFKGTGVGLAITERIIKRHGGRIWAEGQPEKGATFTFALPLTRRPT